jgi:hypothetical protein
MLPWMYKSEESSHKTNRLYESLFGNLVAPLASEQAWVRYLPPSNIMMVI